MYTILVIDDDRITRQTVALGLTNSKQYEVYVAADGFEGIAIAQDIIPDLIICDIYMPEMDGYVVLKTLQRLPATAHIPFMFLTGRADRSSTRRGMESGADDYLAKPFTLSELTAAVEARLSRQAIIQNKYEEQMGALRDNILLALPHELRTPLSTIIGYSDILANESRELPVEKMEKMARAINKSGNRLFNLIENYIIYAQIELILTEPERIAHMRTLREAKPDKIIEQVVGGLMSKTDRFAQMELEAGLEMLPISGNNLEKIIEELVDNAFKFSPADTAVSITSKIEGDQFFLKVSNQGRGMKPEQIQNIGSYMQFGRRIHEQQGSGMGLVIAKRLTELYGGNLTIQSVVGKETDVIVRLPA
jgi:two-component system, sensor histidine kinase and response regulator